MQIEEVVTATKAAQALVEEAHREIELSGIQPVLRLASLDAKIPLSMLQLPSDLTHPAPMQSHTADCGPLSLNSDVAQQKDSLAVSASIEAVAGSPVRDLDTAGMSPDATARSDSTGGVQPGSVPSQRSADRMVSPFALASAPSRS